MSCRLITSDNRFVGKQGFSYREGLSRETVGAEGICMHTLSIPPHTRAKAHMHENHETAIFVVSGRAHTWFGNLLEEHLVAEAGDFFYIPAGVPHLPVNEDDEPCFAVISRTDANEQESVVLLPELDELWCNKKESLQ